VNQLAQSLHGQTCINSELPHPFAEGGQVFQERLPPTMCPAAPHDGRPSRR
jgi:hypothetical protein